MDGVWLWRGGLGAAVANVFAFQSMTLAMYIFCNDFKILNLNDP